MKLSRPVGEHPVRGHGGIPALVQAAQHQALQGRLRAGLPAARGSGRHSGALRDEQLPADVQELLQGQINTLVKSLRRVLITSNSKMNLTSPMQCTIIWIFEL